MSWTRIGPICSFPRTVRTARGLIAVCGLVLVFVAGIAFAQTYQLQAWQGSLPVDAVAAGSDGQGSSLFVCVADSWGGQHPGRLDGDGVCHVPWGGQAHTFEEGFFVLVSSASPSGSWQPMAEGGVPEGAFKAGDDGAPIYVCRVQLDGGLQPGKLTDDGWCYVAIAGEEKYFTNDYEVLVD